MKTVHTQVLNLGERGIVLCTREDTDEEVNFRLTAWKKDGKQTHAVKIRYNIMYDYERIQNWWNGRLVEDLLDTSHCYGHLIAEGCSKGNFKDDFEPVNPLGCELFQNQTWLRELTLFENLVEVNFGYSPYSAYGIQRTGKIVELEIRESARDRFLVQERSRLEGLHFDPLQAREKRLQFYKEYSEWLKTEVPIDMSMVDTIDMSMVDLPILRAGQWIGIRDKGDRKIRRNDPKHGATCRQDHRSIDHQRAHSGNRGKQTGSSNPATITTAGAADTITGMGKTRYWNPGRMRKGNDRNRNDTGKNQSEAKRLKRRVGGIIAGL